MSDLIGNNNYDRFEIVSSGSITIPTFTLNTGGANYAFNNGVTTTVAHDLGFVPSLLAFWDNGGVYVPLPWSTTNGVGSSSFMLVNMRVTVDDTYVYGVSDAFGYNVNSTWPVSTAKYYLLKERAN